MAHMTPPVGSESDMYGTTPVPGPLDTEERGLGWIAFAGTMLMLVGTINVIYGIAAIGNAHFYAGHSSYVFGSLNTWGWVALILGVIQGCTGLALFARNQFARWLGVIFASLNAIAQLLAISSSPFLALSLFTIDILIVYGLIAYGGHVDGDRA